MKQVKLPKLAHLLTLLGLAALALELAPILAEASTSSPEREVFETARRLKPISDEQWKSVAGARITEKYQIIQGDTLFDVSKRLFGDARYWPKLYALNNDTITNPHMIRPGGSISFVPGSGTALPTLALNDQGDPGQMGASGNTARDQTASDAPPPKFTGRSEEWKLLPRQNWEKTAEALPSQVDQYGFDKNSKISVARRDKGFELEAFAATERVRGLGQIIGSRSAGEYLSSGDTVYIRADEDLQVGETYGITQEPFVLKSRKSNRSGFSYLVLGNVKIIGVRDNQFIGTIISAHGFIFRGTMIIPNQPRVASFKPIPAANSVDAIVMLDKHFSSYATAQHKQVFLNRGTVDGVRPGMIFRAYEHYDPSNDKRITSTDFIIDADMIVIQASERFCTAIVINSFVPVNENSTAVLLTDISDLASNRGFSDKSPDNKQRDDELDELDKLDSGGNLGPDEQRELEQLEKWKGNPAPQPSSAPAAETPPPALEPTPGAEATPPATPTDVAPPPPPAAGTETPPAEPPVSAEPTPAPEAAAPPATPGAEPAAPPPPTAPTPAETPTEPSEEAKALDNMLGQ
jgi:hypothetical protein